VLQQLGASLDSVRQAVIQLLEGYTARQAPAGGEVPVGETAYGPIERLPESEWKRPRTPRCSSCGAALRETRAINVVETATDDEPTEVKVAYCTRCGTSLGTVA
jgi:hypothetical protein